VKTAAAASPDKVLHRSMVLAAHRQAEAILKVIFMVLTAAFLRGQLLSGKAELRSERSILGKVYRLGGRTQPYLAHCRGKLTNRE
jgi:hypothetical protein